MTPKEAIKAAKDSLKAYKAKLKGAESALEKAQKSGADGRTLGLRRKSVEKAAFRVANCELKIAKAEAAQK